MEEHNYEELYHTLLGYENKIHEVNQKRIKAGLFCVWLVPIFFLILLLVVDGSKPLLLTLWVGSLFLIAAYLIAVEYGDYKLQEKMAEIKGEENLKMQKLIDISQVSDSLQVIQEKLEKSLNAEEELQEKTEEPVSSDEEDAEEEQKPDSEEKN